MRKIDWTKWSAIAEIVSAIAILVTLLYLAVQTQENTRATLSAAEQALVEREMDSLNTMLANPEITLLFGKPELTSLERAKLYAYLTSFIRARESMFRQFTLGVLDEEVYAGMENVLLAMLQSEHVGNYWANQQLGYNSDFVARVNSQLATNRVVTPIGEEFLEWVFSSPNEGE